MIRQRLHIDRYGWDVTVYHAVSQYWADEIYRHLLSIGCSGEYAKGAYENLQRSELNTGLTYSNLRDRVSVVVIALTSSAEEYINSFCHELRHLCNHIEEGCGIDSGSEEACYLAGDLAAQMYRESHKLMCDNCRSHE